MNNNKKTLCRRLKIQFGNKKKLAKNCIFHSQRSSNFETRYFVYDIRCDYFQNYLNLFSRYKNLLEPKKVDYISS